MMTGRPNVITGNRWLRLRAPAAVIMGAALLTACGGSSSPDKTGGSSGKPSVTALKSTVAGVEVTTDPAIAASVPDAIRKTGTLKNITYDNAPPDTFVKDGQTVGWEVDLAQAVATVMGLKLKTTTSGAFDTFIPGIQNGRYNTSISSLIQTPVRLKQIDVVTYFKVATGFAKKAGSPITVAQETDVCGHKVATLSGSAFVDQLKVINGACSTAGKPTISVQLYPAAANATLAVANGRAELYASSSNQLSYMVSQTPGQFELTDLQYDPVDEGAGITKGSGLSKPFAVAMDKLIKSGTYGTILKKWGITVGLVDSATVHSSD